jgi:1-acyl-sn-glycerol-3-phosphate acyltransferase
MDRKISSLSIFDKLYSIFLLLWVGIFTSFYASGCILMSPFSRTTARKIGRLWNQHLLVLSRIKLEIHGLERLDKNKRYVFIANHQSALDIPVLYAGMEVPLSFIAKKELFLIPFFGWGMAAVGHVWIDRSNARKARSSITQAVNHLRKEKVSLVLFPEGTRSADGVVGDFKQGSFTLALQAGVEVVPIVLHDTRLRLPKQSLMVCPGTIHVDVCEPITVDEKTMSKSDLCSMVRNRITEVIAVGPKCISLENSTANLS